MKNAEKNILDLNTHKSEIGPGWHFLVDAVNTLAGRDIDIFQVKEKFGTLRIYYKLKDHVKNPNDSQNIHGIVSRAEYWSSYTCENTGKAGSLRDVNGWYKTLCEDEYQKAISAIKNTITYDAATGKVVG